MIVLKCYRYLVAYICRPRYPCPSLDGFSINRACTAAVPAFSRYYIRVPAGVDCWTTYRSEAPTGVLTLDLGIHLYLATLKMNIRGLICQSIADATSQVPGF